MPKIYIANTSNKDWIVNCRPIPMGQTIVRKISSGRQEEIRDLDDAELKGIVAHLVRYGAVTRDQLNRHTKGYEGLAYSLDIPFTAEQYRYGAEQVLDEAETRSVVEASKAALASDMIINTPGEERMTGLTSVEMEEITPMKNSGGKRKSMSITVDPRISRSDKVALQ